MQIKLFDLPGVSESDKEMLRKQGSFAFTYLIFDLDLQHYDLAQKNNIVRGIGDVKEMLQHFCDETDPTIGKLYINYPMIESFRDCASFFDNNYKNTVVSLQDITKYKKIVSERGLNFLYVNIVTIIFVSLSDKIFTKHITSEARNGLNLHIKNIWNF